VPKLFISGNQEIICDIENGYSADSILSSDKDNWGVFIYYEIDTPSAFKIHNFDMINGEISIEIIDDKKMKIIFSGVAGVNFRADGIDKIVANDPKLTVGSSVGGLASEEVAVTGLIISKKKPK